MLSDFLPDGMDVDVEGTFTKFLIFCSFSILKSISLVLRCWCAWLLLQAIDNPGGNKEVLSEKQEGIFSRCPAARSNVVSSEK